jgi:hypothetical protein
MKKRRKNKSLGATLLSAVKKNGKKAKANSSVKLSLKSLRRLLSAARSGKRTAVKARVH